MLCCANSQASGVGLVRLGCALGADKALSSAWVYNHTRFSAIQSHACKISQFPFKLRLRDTGDPTLGLFNHCTMTRGEQGTPHPLLQDMTLKGLTLLLLTDHWPELVTWPLLMQTGWEMLGTGILGEQYKGTLKYWCNSEIKKKIRRDFLNISSI